MLPLEAVIAWEKGETMSVRDHDTGFGYFPTRLGFG